MSHTAHDLQLDRRDTALVVIDIQERLFAAMDPAVQESVVQKTRILIEGARQVGVSILATEQYPKGLGPTVTPIREALGGDVEMLEKIEFNCGAADGFLGKLRERGIQKVVLCGMEAHICVLQTAAGLMREGFGVWVAEDAICSRFKANWKAGRRLAAEAGAVVAPVEAVLFMLLGKAGTPEFKAISKLVR